MAIELRDKKEFNPNWVKRETHIHWLVDGNPKRPHGKSYNRFERYFGVLTVGEYYDESGTKGDLRHDWQHWFLDLSEGIPQKVSDAKAAANNVRYIKEFTQRFSASESTPQIETTLDEALIAELTPELEVAEITEEELLAS